VVIEHDHLIVEIAPFAVRITEIAMVRIDGREPLAPGQLHLPAPQRAQNLQVLPAPDKTAALVVQDGVLVNPAALALGQHQFQFQYELVDASPTVRITLPRSYPTTAMDILLPSEGVAARAPGLQSAGNFEVEGRSFQRLSGHNLAAGQALELFLTRPAAAERRHDSTAVWLMTALVLLGILALLRSILIARRSGAGPPAARLGGRG
jgi:hypothetical protein